MAYFTGQSDADIYCQVVDYGIDYPNAIDRSLGEVSYRELRSGKIKVMGKEVPTSPLSSYFMAREIALKLKDWIIKYKFTLGIPQLSFPTVEFKGSIDDFCG
jgi:uncharacterized protein (DUF39 family)